MAFFPSTKTKYLTIKAGDTGVLRKNVRILSVVSDGNAEADSDCITLPEAEPLVCFSLKWAVESDEGGGTGPWSIGDTDALITDIIIANTTYSVNLPIDGGNNDVVFPAANNPSDLEIYIAANIPSSVMTPVDLSSNPVGERREMTFLFKAAESIGSQVYFRFTGPGFTDGALIYAQLCDGCCDDEET